MSQIKLQTDEASAIRNKLINLNQRQFDVGNKLNSLCTDELYVLWDGEVPGAFGTRFRNIKRHTAAITEMMNKYTDALDFAIKELEEADRRAAEQRAREEAERQAAEQRAREEAEQRAREEAAKNAANNTASGVKSTLRWDAIPANEIQTDSFNGVPSYVNQKNFVAAKYGTYYDVGFTGGERNCAEYVKRYYTTIYNRYITGLTPTGSPSGLVQTSSPNPGDVIRTVVGGTVHWAIVKEIKNGMAVVIEQNTVYKSGSGYALSVNNAYSVNGNRFYTRP